MEFSRLLKTTQLLKKSNYYCFWITPFLGNIVPCHCIQYCAEIYWGDMLMGHMTWSSALLQRARPCFWPLFYDASLRSSI
ncbi:hypothetical protein CIB84_004327 [Bambusicola thoracicus]|uniref:Uncharacterized protein n=1 Tax=Bambusicola thoracicus TaxID=9083 RepID=A0A2P4T6E5_BAMTH|nr:hypothetical protein CIB84_004327 [Bambusicola thoracicus]